MISKVVIFFNANISLPNFVWKFKQFFFKKNLPWLDHVYPTKFKVRLILVLNPRPLNAQGFFDGSNWHVIESFNTPTLIGRFNGAVYPSGCKGGLA